MTKEPKTSAKDNPLVRALSRWENEGGRTDADWEKRAVLVEEEEHILASSLFGMGCNESSGGQPMFFGSAERRFSVPA